MLSPVRKARAPYLSRLKFSAVFLRRLVPWPSVDIQGKFYGVMAFISERELTFTFAICFRPSVCRLSVTFVRPTQAVQIFGNISVALGTMATR